MDYLSSYKLANGMPSEAQQSPLPIEMQRLQIEVQRRDAIIEEQQKRIFQLEDEVKRCNKQIQDLVMQLSQFKDQKPKQDQNYKPAQSRYWTAEEHDRFLDAVKRFGPKDVKAIASYVGTRNPTQVRTHAQKYYLRLERERKRKEETDPGKIGSGNSPSDGLENYNPDAKSPNDDSSTQSTPPDPNSIPNPQDDKLEDDKKNPRKRASSTGRRASMPADIASVHMKPESTPGLTPPVPSSTVVHSTRQQLQSAAPIVSSLKGWSPQEYNLFIEGLLSFPEEKDINKKCKLISEKFLPKYSPEDIKQCYAILHNYVRNKEGNPSMPTDEHTAYMEANKRLKTMEGMSHGYNMPTYTTTSIGSPTPDMHPTLRYQLPYQGQQMRGYPPYHPYGGVPGYPGNSPYPPGMNDVPPQSPQTPFSDPSMMRRASYPMDTFSLNKTYPDMGENLFPPEFPTPWSNENGPANGQSTNNDDMNPQENQRGNNL